MSAKPICIMKVDFEIVSKSHGQDTNSLMADLQKAFEDKMPDYHVFVIPNDNREEPIDLLEIQTFYEKDQLPIDYESLKKIIEIHPQC